MGRDRRDLEVGALEGATVQALDVLEHVLDGAARDRRRAGVEAVEHEGVVGVRAVPEAQRSETGGRGACHDAHLSPRSAAC